MKYEKPEILLSGSALTTVQGAQKVGDDSDSPHSISTESAYEADE
jgi:hypothetical protein